MTLKVFRGATPEEIEAATEPNMQVKIVGQPEAKRLEKDAVVRFTGTLVGYTQNPFMLTWDKAKINPEDLPEEKAGPAKKGAGKKSSRQVRAGLRLKFSDLWHEWPREFTGAIFLMKSNLSRRIESCTPRKSPGLKTRAAACCSSPLQWRGFSCRRMKAPL